MVLSYTVSVISTLCKILLGLEKISQCELVQLRLLSDQLPVAKEFPAQCKFAALTNSKLCLRFGSQLFVGKDL